MLKAAWVVYYFSKWKTPAHMLISSCIYVVYSLTIKIRVKHKGFHLQKIITKIRIESSTIVKLKGKGIRFPRNRILSLFRLLTMKEIYATRGERPNSRESKR